MGINGIINVNKPEGKTSFSIVARLKHLTGERHVGHAGTLDPIATGVLPVCFGQGTRIIQFLIETNKVYLAQIELGTTTDSLDREGTILQHGDTSNITLPQIESVLTSFRGTIEQIPPVYSALKHQGKRFYELARAGMSIQPKARKIKIHNLELVDWAMPIVTLKIDCSKGTYVRSLAHDIGQSLGCGAHLKDLVRLQCGHFRIEDALSINQIESAFRQGLRENIFCPVDSVLSDWKALIVDEKTELAIRNGRSLPLGKEAPPSEEYCRAYSPTGHFIAILHFLPEKKLWHPDKVFSLQQFPCTEESKSLDIPYIIDMS